MTTPTTKTMAMTTMSPRDGHLAERICEGRLRRLAHLRRAIDQWAAGGRAGRLPQPRDFDLRLADLRADEVIGLNDAHSH